MTETSSSPWTLDDARELYSVDVWGDGFFSINEHGNVSVRPIEDNPDLRIDINDVVAEALESGSTLPLLVRFQDIISSRVRRLNRKFRDAIAAAGYEGSYRSIFPIKVNQLQEVVAEVMDAGREFNNGIECGSKAELMAALPLIGSETLLLCNGVKDHVMLTLMLNAQQLGQQVVPIIEKYSEFEQLMILADQRQMSPRLGVRVKLNTRGAGRWYESGGARSKFGLTVPELLRLVKTLEKRNQGHCLELLHFHLGSQISDIQVLRSAVKEITQIYADLVLRGVKVQFLDVGGGLGVNYGGDYDNPESSINYGLREYANVIVYAVKEICDEREVPVPTLLSESGRALTAHHSMLIIPVLGVHRPDSPPMNDEPPADSPAVVTRMETAFQEASETDVTGILLECYHDAREIREEADQLMRLGYLTLDQLAHTDSLYWSTCREVLRKLAEAELATPPTEQLELEEQLTDLYLCDFSVFHSIIDHWAIQQVFPVMPLHRLNERPERRAQVVDLTCDSDGKIDQYVCGNTNTSWLPLHTHKHGEPYHLGIFLVGAYQEILGDAHNLLGRVDEVHVYARDDESGNFWIEETLKGISIKDMLSQVQYFPNDLDRRMTELIRKQINAGIIKAAEGSRILNNYTRRLDESTYCTTEVVR
ncbi:MAG TPA: biosynthetic arginine decarboxylase [Pseudohongiella sp.]|nr:arginine decarboxylase [Gammaproteobacteria bacterium]MBJ54548.1 arginine decarboxylase [Gammaproteobacteria bacterium]HBX38580.1 biosynthetic arginine decarboxylase [Pseudohongiella sp.]|tara:strand:- start:2643 stop:4592 length:1950 start_codon:yes stop_codon:yes gene_type:complete